MANQYRSVLASSGPAPTGGDALPAEVLSGKTFTNDNGAQTGTMVNNGAVSQTLSGGQSYTIPEGYHNGNGVVTASSASIIAIKSHATGTSGGTETFTTEVNDLVIITGASAISGHITVTGGTDVTSDYSSVIDGNTSDYMAIYKATGTSLSVTNDASVANRSSIQIRGIV